MRKPRTATGYCQSAALALLLPGVLFLGACGYSESPSTAMADYRLALAEALGGEASSLKVYPPFFLDYPAKAERTLTAAEVNVDLRSFWGFSHCELRAVIAGRNTALGRTNSAVVQFPYEQQLLTSLNGCLRPPEDVDVSENTMLQLKQVYDRKAASIASVVWNNTFGSREFVTLFSPSAGILGDEAATVYVPTPEMEYLRRFAAEFGEPSASMRLDQLPDAFQALERSEFGGRLLKSLHEANFYLSEINALLSRRLNAGKVCLMASANAQARALQQVFRRYHIRVIQPYLATMSRIGQPWLRATGELARDQSATMPPGFTEFYEAYLEPDAPGGLWRQHRELVRTHAGLWSRLFDQCGMSLR